MQDSKDDIERYRNGTLSDKERHALEKRALSDPFLADALEGAESIPAGDFSADLSDLSGKIRSARKENWFTPLRIAAGVIMLLGTGSVFYFLSRPEPATLAFEKKSDAKSGSGGIAPQKDSSQLLTLAKPAEENQAPKTNKATSPAREAAGSPKGKEKPEQTKDTREPETARSLAQADQIADDKKAEEVVVDQQAKSIVQAEEQPAVSSQGAGVRSLAAPDENRKQKAARAQADFANRRTISGRVTSSEDGSALPGVNVNVAGSSQGTVTDTDGNYTITTDVQRPQLVFSFIGLATQQIEAPQQNANVQMKPDAGQLSEIVVTGYGMASDKKEDRDDYNATTELAGPVGGKDAFQKYLETNVQYPARALSRKTEGRVTVQFTLKANGTLTDFITLRGIGDGCEEELIRLIQQGPRWNPTMNNGRAVEEKVKVRFKFTLPE